MRSRPMVINRTKLLRQRRQETVERNRMVALRVDLALMQFDMSKGKHELYLGLVTSTVRQSRPIPSTHSNDHQPS